MTSDKLCFQGTAANPPAWRHAFWLTFLVVASVAFSLGFACAVPLAAFAAVAALTLKRQDALILAGAVWLTNQLVGYGLLGYPRTVDSFAWGFAIGAVTILATVISQSVTRRLASQSAVLVSAVAFTGAFLLYEGGLHLVAATILGGTASWAPTIVWRMLEINAAGFVGLLVLNRLAIVGGLTANFAGPYADIRKLA